MKAHMPEPRGEVAVSVLDGQLYALAGAAQGQDATPLVEAYNPQPTPGGRSRPFRGA
jgi:hypothetical protein